MEQSNRRQSGYSLPETSLAEQPESQISKISESPLFPIDLHEIIEVAQLLFKSALPTSLTYIASVVTGLVSLRFAGKYGNAAELAGASLGYTWANIFCLGFFISIDHGFAIIASRLFGAEKHRELGVLYQRNVLMICALAIPMILPMIFADSILLSLGLDAEISLNAGIYLRNAIPSIIGSFLFNTTRFFLISQNIFNVQSVILGALVPLHIFWCYLFVDVFGMPVAGAALAKSVTDVIAIILLILYVKYAGVCKESWIPWTKECLEGWGSHFKQTLMLGANTYFEWIAYEISMFIVGAMNDPYVMGAHGVAVNFTSAMFYIPLGTSVSMQALIGNAVGEGSTYKAQKIVVAGSGLNLVFTLFNAFTMIFFNRQISIFFISDQTSRLILEKILIIYGLASIPDSYANCLGGVLRVVGKEKEVLTSFFICYMVIGVNAQWISGLVMGYGIIAIWLSTAASILIMFALMLRKVMHLNWSEEIAKVKKSLDETTDGESQNYIEMVEMP